MKYNRLYFGLTLGIILCIAGIPISILLVSDIIDNFNMIIFDIRDGNTIAMLAFDIFWFLFITIIEIAFISGFAAFFAMFGRPVRFSEKGVSHGYIIREFISWGEIINVFKVPYIDTHGVNYVKGFGQNSICIISGNTKFVHAQKCGSFALYIDALSNMICRAVANCDIRLKASDMDDYIPPQKVISLKYNDVLFADILDEWKKHIAAPQGKLIQ